MSPFTIEEISFLARHGCSDEDVYDGRYETKHGREASAKQLGKNLILTNVIGRGECKTLRHRLRTRAGHCFQCQPKRIAFQRRENAAGSVYIAGSMQGRLIKIGSAKDVGQRERQIRAEGYGGYSDWIILFSVRSEEIGRLERDVSERVSGERVYGTYTKDGIEQTAVEMLRAPFSAALEAMNRCISDEMRRLAWQSRRTSSYEFSY